MGRLHPIGIVFASLVIALTYLGAEDAQLFMQIPAAVGFVFQGLVLFYLLGAELLVKGHKVLFINSNFLTYEWVFKKNTISGPFWHKGLDEKKIFKKINYLLNISDKKFNKISKANFDLLEYDQNNTKLNKLLNI